MLGLGFGPLGNLRKKFRERRRENNRSMWDWLAGVTDKAHEGLQVDQDKKDNGNFWERSWESIKGWLDDKIVRPINNFTNFVSGFKDVKAGLRDVIGNIGTEISTFVTDTVGINTFGKKVGAALAIPILAKAPSLISKWVSGKDEKSSNPAKVSKPVDPSKSVEVQKVKADAVKTDADIAIKMAEAKAAKNNSNITVSPPSQQSPSSVQEVYAKGNTDEKLDAVVKALNQQSKIENDTRKATLKLFELENQKALNESSKAKSLYDSLSSVQAQANKDNNRILRETVDSVQKSTQHQIESIQSDEKNGTGKNLMKFALIGGAVYGIYKLVETFIDKFDQFKEWFGKVFGKGIKLIAGGIAKLFTPFTNWGKDADQKIEKSREKYNRKKSNDGTISGAVGNVRKGAAHGIRTGYNLTKKGIGKGSGWLKDKLTDFAESDAFENNPDMSKYQLGKDSVPVTNLVELPAYKDGTDNHDGGPAIVGDGFVPELIKAPGDSTRVSPAVPTVVDMPVGTKVKPVDDKKDDNSRILKFDYKLKSTPNGIVAEFDGHEVPIPTKLIYNKNKSAKDNYIDQYNYRKSVILDYLSKNDLLDKYTIDNKNGDVKYTPLMMVGDTIAKTRIVDDKGVIQPSLNKDHIEFDQVKHDKIKEQLNHERSQGRPNLVELPEYQSQYDNEPTGNYIHPDIKMMWDPIDGFTGPKIEQSPQNLVERSGMDQRVMYVDNWLKENTDWNAHQRAGIIGTLIAESNLNPKAENKWEKRRGLVTKRGTPNYGRGIAQWSNSRIDEFHDWLKSIHGFEGDLTEAGMDRQLEYMLKEMKARPAFMKAMNNATDVRSATDAMLRGFENGGTNALASIDQMNETYSKYGNDYNKQMRVRLSHANRVSDLTDSNDYHPGMVDMDVINGSKSADGWSVSIAESNEDPKYAALSDRTKKTIKMMADLLKKTGMVKAVDYFHDNSLKDIAGDVKDAVGNTNIPKITGNVKDAIITGSSKVSEATKELVAEAGTKLKSAKEVIHDKIEEVKSEKDEPKVVNNSPVVNNVKGGDNVTNVTNNYNNTYMWQNDALGTELS